MREEEYKTGAGEVRAWKELAACDPARVQANSLVAYDSASGTYTLEILGEFYRVDPRSRSIANISNPVRPAELLLGLAVPVYMAGARPVPPSGELVKEFSGGEFFYRGAHTLPLDEIAGMYCRDCGAFGTACRKELGGEAFGLGDCGFSFRVFPRVTMAFALWLEDAEFTARASLLFDSNAALHLPLDVLWAVALLSCRRLLDFEPTWR